MQSIPKSWQQKIEKSVQNLVSTGAPEKISEILRKIEEGRED
jgi:hypothetical protein